MTAQSAMWEMAQPPFPPPASPARVTRVPNAMLSSYSRGPLATQRQPRQWVMGAVYEESGRLVQSSQLVIASPEARTVAADPLKLRVRPPRHGRLLEGTWLYGGRFGLGQYGHFLTETIPTLWPVLGELPALSGLVFHSRLRQAAEPQTWQRQLLDLLGVGDLPIALVRRADGQWRADEVLVPSRTVALHAWALPEAHRVWSSMADAFRSDGGPERVYVSRTGFNASLRDSTKRKARSSASRDRELDRVFADHGFEIVRPETLSIRDQVRLVAASRCLAGQSGSGLHQSAFMPRGGRVIEIGDARFSDHPVGMQVAIDAASGHERVFLQADTPATEVDRALHDLGL